MLSHLLLSKGLHIRGIKRLQELHAILDTCAPKVLERDVADHVQDILQKISHPIIAYMKVSRKNKDKLSLFSPLLSLFSLYHFQITSGVSLLCLFFQTDLDISANVLSISIQNQLLQTAKANKIS
jgi:hypothetical protein